MSEIDYEKAYDEARSARARLRNVFDTERHNLISEATRSIDAALDEKYGAELNRLARAEQDAHVARDDARVRATAAQSLPSGVLVEWKNQESARFMRDWKLRQTGRKGIIEVVTRDSRFPGNTGDYRRPRPGDVIVRILKKDGTAGLPFEKWTANPSWGPQWHPENWTPPTQA